jgi:hypothetical protein
MNTVSMSSLWYRKRQEARRRKEARRQAAKDVWYVPAHREEAAPVEPQKPYIPDPNPSSWFQFCTDRSFAYESRGDRVAAMVWWAMRWWDDPELGSEDDPCTEAGYQKLGEYWAYKLNLDEDAGSV